MRILLCVVVLILSGCTPETGQLQQQLRQLEMQVDSQEKENARLREELAQYRDLSATLENEKEAKDMKLIAIKSKTRRFIKEGFDSLNRFTKNRELMDYIGGEPIERKMKEGKNLTVIHMEPLPSDSMISVIEGLFDAGTQIILQLFREKEGELICVWQGRLFDIEASGQTVLELDTPLHALAGDYFAIYFPGKVGVPYNAKTGSFSLLSGKVELGENVSGKIEGASRNYSMGIAGFME